MPNASNIAYPAAPRDETVLDNYFGVEVKDPYRWLENPESEETKRFIEQQNTITRRFLDGCPYRERIKKTLTSMWDYPKYSCPFREGNNYFFFKNTGLQNQSVLYIQQKLDGEAKVFLDPNSLSLDGTVALSRSEFSEDGSIFAYGLSSGGSDWMTIQFRKVETMQDYPETLTRVKFSTISWTHDNKGIFYGMYPFQDDNVQEKLKMECDEHQKLYYHRVGTLQSEDILVAEFPEEPKFRMTTDVSHCGRYLILYLQKGCRDNLVYFCDLKAIKYKITGKLPLTQVGRKLDADYEYVTNTGSLFVFRTNKNASNYRLIVIDFQNPEEDKWTVLIDQHELDVLDWAVPVNKDKLIVCYMRHVKDVLQYHELSSGKLIHTFPLEVGTVVSFSGKKKYSEIFFKFVSFTTPGIVYRCNLEDPKFKTEIHSEVKPRGFSRENYETQQVFVKSKDGTKVPMFIVHKRGLQMNGTNPCLLYGYGGFNISIKPYFNVIKIVFIHNLDGVLAIPNIRGGGEYGDKWHNQGRFSNKQNTFDDFHAAAEYLIQNKFTSPEYLTAKGDSNGGLVVAACAIQRPDLFGAVLCGAGVLDMLRFHKFTIGAAWVSDYGSSDVKEQFAYLFKYSPLHNVMASSHTTQFPAFLLTTADHDDRVVPFHSLKLVATLQHVFKDSPKQTNPLLLRVDENAGHGEGKPTSKLFFLKASSVSNTAFLLNASLYARWNYINKHYEGGVVQKIFSRLLHLQERLKHLDKIEAYSKEFSAFLERRHVVSNTDTPGQRANTHTTVNDTGTQMSHIMNAEHASPAPTLGTLSSVVMHSPLTTALGSGNSNSSLSPSPTPQSKTSETHNQILSRPRLQELVREVDASEQLDEEVEELLLQLADDFVESTVNAACIFAKHRHANTVDIKDVQLHLERNWNMSIPGFGADELRPYKRASMTEAHKQRMALIRKALKKY